MDFIITKKNHMKKLFTLLLVCLTFGMFAQTEGEIIYKTTINIHKQLKGDRAEDLKKMLPETQSFKHVLYFNDEATLFKKHEEETDVAEEDLDRGSRRGRRMMMRMAGGGQNDQMYVDLEEETVVQQTEFLGKTFLITDDIEERKWKLTKETKTINGYVCYKAILQIKKKEPKQKEAKKEEAGEGETKVKDDKSGKKDDAKKEEAKKDEGQQEGRGRRGRRDGWNRGPKSVVAWYTPSIPVAAGPSNFTQLPGMVMQVEIDGTNRVITAEKVTLKTLEEKTIKKPKKGKKVTREEYRKIVKEKMDEMRKERGGRGGKMRIHRN